MDSYPDMVQVLTLTNPPIEAIAEPRLAVELSQIANDEMAELVQKHPDRFIGAVATLPLNDMDATLREIDRAINDLHLQGFKSFPALPESQWIPLSSYRSMRSLPL